MTWLIDKQIPSQGVITLYGASGEGKSFYALGLGMQVARQSLVVYIASEGEAGYKKRVHACLNHHGLHKSDVRIVFCMGSFSIMDDQDKETFIEKLSKDRPSLVIVDTVAQTMIGADENSARDMSKYLKGCKDLLRGLGCAVFLVHHTGKSRTDERGSSALRAACDVMIRLTAEDDIIRVECSKTKDEAPFPTQYIRLLPVSVPNVGDSVVAVPAEKVLQSPDDPLTEKQSAVLNLLNTPIYVDGASNADIETSLNYARATLHRALNILIERHYVERAERGVFSITEKGRLQPARLSHLSHTSSHSEQSDKSDGNGTGSQLSHLSHSNLTVASDQHETTGETSETNETNANTSDNGHTIDGVQHETMGETTRETNETNQSGAVKNPRPLFSHNLPETPDSYYSHGG
jgi:hypothetical protein